MHNAKKGEDSQLDGATAEKYRFIRAQQQMRIDAGVEFLAESEVPILPAWEAQIKQLEEMKEKAVDAPVAEG